MTQTYALKGRKVASEPYHYTQCGLDDVYLLNGYKRHKTPYGEGVTVENVEQLQHAIALNLSLNKPVLSGKEFRFLRKLMDLTQSELAGYFGCNVQSVARWEKVKSEMNGAADKLLRILYLGTVNFKISAEDLIKQLSEMDTSLDGKQVFEKTERAWKAAA